MLNSFYQKSSLLTTLHAYFSDLKAAGLSKPMGLNYFWLCLALLVIGDRHSIRHLFEQFLGRVTKHSLNTFYRALAVIGNHLPQLEVRNLTYLLTLIPTTCQDLPLLLVLDDTVQPKFGHKFTGVKYLFDHAAHTGKRLVNAHDFVTLGLMIPTQRDQDDQPVYTFLPLATHLYQAEQATKYQQAAQMIKTTLKSIASDQQVFLLCDSWYPKAEINQLVMTQPNLAMIANVRKDTAMFGLPKRTGKRGRPRKYGDQIHLGNIALNLCSAGDQIGIVRCLTRLMPQPVYMIRVQRKTTCRLFMATCAPEELAAITTETLAVDPTQLTYRTPETSAPAPALRALAYYQKRWAIETYFYEMKTFWHFGDYAVRSVAKIEADHHLLNTAYTLMIVLPLTQPSLAFLVTKSLRERKLWLSRQIQAALFLASLARQVQRRLKTTPAKVVIQWLASCWSGVSEKL
ncbi:IS701 family transposase [Loigolactobacillus coryniformis]|uniref:IS701 family transposase n=1 Tax=Loigolactobacillus coryniformis TaxID=1610 RepID=UPI0011AB3B79|nr:transposase [Loigolactobacillus coryniformis]